MPELTWKTVIRATWLPNVIILILLAWLICTDQGWLRSQPKLNEARIRQIEDRMNQIDEATLLWREERIKKDTHHKNKSGKAE